MRRAGRSAQRRRAARTAAVIAAPLVAACAVGPDYQPPPLAAPAQWQELAEAHEVVTTAPEDLDAWWQRLDDDLLTQLVQEALEASPDLLRAQARLREAHARTDVAGAARYPQVSASGAAGASYSARNDGVTSRAGELTDNGGGRFSAGLDASWELDVFGGVRRSVEAARADEEATLATLADVQVALVAEVARSYVELRALQKRLAVAHKNLESQSETLRLTEFRAEAGLVGAADVEQARSNREQTRAQLPALEASLAEAEHRIDVLLGKQPGTLYYALSNAGDIPSLPEQIAVGIPADTLRRRPDVRAAERALAAETARVGVAEAAKYPSFRLSGSLGLDALVGVSGLTGGIVSSLLGGIVAPLFQGGRLRAQAEAQEAVRDQALIGYENALNVALQDVEDALVALAKNRERAGALSRALESGQIAARLAGQSYAAGLTDFQTVLDTERTLLSVEDNLTTTRADGVQALIRLYEALGGGWSPASDAAAAPTPQEDS